MRAVWSALLVAPGAFALGCADGAQASTTQCLQSTGVIQSARSSRSNFMKLIAALGIAASAVACGSSGQQPVIAGTTVAEVFPSPLPYPGTHGRTMAKRCRRWRSSRQLARLIVGGSRPHSSHWVGRSELSHRPLRARGSSSATPTMSYPDRYRWTFTLRCWLMLDRPAISTDQSSCT